MYETCKKRKWKLWVSNVRTNHIHSVVSAQCPSLTVVKVLKAHAARTMRESGCWTSERTPWAYRGSRKKLWAEKDRIDAIIYVEMIRVNPCLS